jgi:regulator of replication initiation timing
MPSDSDTSKYARTPWYVTTDGGTANWPERRVEAAEQTVARVYYHQTPNGEAIQQANARRIVACVNFCEGVPTADLENSLELEHTLADEDEAIVAKLNEAGEERNELRDENERLKKRVAELEEAGGDATDWNRHAQERIEELEAALLRIRDWIEEKGYRGEGEHNVFDESWHPEAHLDLHSMLVKDARAVFASLSSDGNAAQAEVPHE